MRLLRVAAPLLALGLAVSACGSAAATPAPATPAPSTAATAAPQPASAPVSLADTSLGKVLVGNGGMTLYVFLADTGGKSTCNGDCAAKWPAMTSTPVPGTGLDASAFATTTRDDGSTQVTFHGQPVYYFAKDTAAGQTNGQGLGSSWYVVGADGKPIK